MNKCYFIGKVSNAPIFDFLYLKDHISICYFTLTLDSDTHIKIFGFDEVADYIYKKVNINHYVCIEGLLCTNNDAFTAQITNIEILKKWDDL